MNRRPRLLYLIPAEGFGGAERQAIFHISRLSDHSFDVVVVTGPGRKVQAAIAAADCTVYHTPLIPREYARPFSLLSACAHVAVSAVSFVRSLAFLRKIVGKERIDVIFAGRFTGWILAVPLSKMTGIPAVWRFGSCVHGWLRRRAFRLLCNLYPPQGAVANCRAVAESVAPLMRMPVAVVPNGIDDSFINPHDVRLSGPVIPPQVIAQDVPVVGLAVRPSPDKGMDFLAEVVRIVNCNEKKIHFCIAGEFGWRRSIEEAFARRGIAGSVSFLGHVEDIRAFYLRCDIVALTSRGRSVEGFPNALLEAMALECPVITTAAGGVAELVEHGRTGIIVNDTDPAVFARELLQLAADREKRIRIGEAARRTVIRQYAAASVMPALVQCIHAASGGGAGRHVSRLAAAVIPPIPPVHAVKALLPLLVMLRLAVGGYAAVNETTARKNITLHPDDFLTRQVVDDDDNYYSIRTDPDCAAVIHAEYAPPARVYRPAFRFPESYPVIRRISWDWRIIRPPSGSLENVRGKNDSGAALYVVFRKKMRVMVIKYVFSELLAPGMSFVKTLPSPLHKMTVVVKSSLTVDKPGTWVHAEADIEADYRRFFDGDDYPAPGGIGLLTDGDQTKSRVIADYANITLCAEE